MLRGRRAELPISEILVKDRGRHLFESIKKMADSIVKTKGTLIHPIVVREARPEEAQDGKKYVLHAGERRLRAYIYLKRDTIPADVWPDDMQPWEEKLVELVENKHRQNLAWDEEVAMSRRVQDMLKESGEAGTIAEVAELLNISTSKAAADIELSDMVDKIPELKKCQTKTEAYKVVARAKEKLVAAELARRAEKQAVDDDKTDNLMRELIDSYIVGDFFLQVANVRDGMFDIIECDPPYGIDLDVVIAKRGDASVAKGEYQEVPREQYDEFIQKVIAESYRVLKPDGWMLLWQDARISRLAKTQELAFDAGFTSSEIPFVWVTQSACCLNPGISFQKNISTALVLRKGKALLNKEGHSSWLNIPKLSDKEHDAERPILLYRQLLSAFGPKSSKVLVCFAGSGAPIIAAKLEGMHSIGFDSSQVNKNNYILKLKRLIHNGHWAIEA